MRYPTMAFICTVSLSIASINSLAHGGGGGGGMGGGFSHGGPVGPPSRGALDNSNGRFSTDRDKGLDRSTDRRREGATHGSKKGHRQKHHVKSGADSDGEFRGPSIDPAPPLPSREPGGIPTPPKPPSPPSLPSPPKLP